MSELLKQVYKRLGIKGIRTILYHTQTDGLTECFNQTLKQMLHKFVSDKSDDLDQWLPCLIFSIGKFPRSRLNFLHFNYYTNRRYEGC